MTIDNLIKQEIVGCFHLKRNYLTLFVMVNIMKEENQTKCVNTFARLMNH